MFTSVKHEKTYNHANKGQRPLSRYKTTIYYLKAAPLPTVSSQIRQMCYERETSW